MFWSVCGQCRQQSSQYSESGRLHTMPLRASSTPPRSLAAPQPSPLAVSNSPLSFLSQYFSVPGAERWPVPLPGLAEHGGLSPGPQQPALPLPAAHPPGPRGRGRLPHPERGQQHRQPARRHDAPGYRKHPGWVWEGGGGGGGGGGGWGQGLVRVWV